MKIEFFQTSDTTFPKYDNPYDFKEKKVSFGVVSVYSADADDADDITQIWMDWAKTLYAILL